MPFMARYDPFSPTPEHPLLNSGPDYPSRNGAFRVRPIGEYTSQISFRERNKRLKDYDDDKNRLIDELLFHLDSTETQLAQLRVDHSREAQYNRDGKSREKSLQDQLRRVKDAMDHNAFIIALLDGDGMIFNIDHLTKGEKGGAEAATALSTAMTDFAADLLSHLHSLKLVVRIYANFASLSTILVINKLIDDVSTFNEFVRGFNSSKLLFDFVDAGSSKDATCEKIGEMLRMNLDDCRCHQVLVGCSNNIRYAHILQEVRQNQHAEDHLTLVEGPHSDTDLATFQHHFRSTKFEGVFSTSRLNSISALPKPPPAVAAALPALTRIESIKSNGSASPGSTPLMNWATVTAQAQALPTTKTDVARTLTPSSSGTGELNKKESSDNSIGKNRLGMRVDRVDSSIPNYDIQRVKKLKLCNVYYLQGKDLCTSANCSHHHDYPVSNYERKVLREVARMTPCYYKTDCEDPDCIYGHRCPQSKPNEPGCYYGENCRFYGWGHGIDTRSCRTVKI